MAGSIKIQHGATASTPQAGFSTLWASSADGEFYYTKANGVTESLIGPTGSAGSQGIQGPTGIGLGLSSKCIVGITGGQFTYSGGDSYYDWTFSTPFNSTDYSIDIQYQAGGDWYDWTGPIVPFRYSNKTTAGIRIIAPSAQISSIIPDFLMNAQAIAAGETSVSYYGDFLSTITQTNAGATAANTVTFNTTNLSSGVSVVSNSRITIANAGIYNIEFSAQLQKSSGGDDIAEIWLAKNGTNVPDSGGKVVMTANPAFAVPAWNYLVQANAGDYYELKWHSADTTMQLNATAAATNPTRPAVPSIILSVSQISS